MHVHTTLTLALTLPPLLPSLQTLLDAAVLAVAHSKARAAGGVKVALTRARNVSKPAGAGGGGGGGHKAGTVQLSGELLHVSVNTKAEGRRLARLELQQQQQGEGGEAEERRGEEAQDSKGTSPSGASAGSRSGR